MKSELPIKPIGDKILLKFVEVDDTTQTSSGLIIENNTAKKNQKYSAVIVAVGEDVNLEDSPFEIGNKVVFNQYDLMAVDFPKKDNPAETETYGIVQAKNIFAVYND